jgi:NADH-quinone oxidoreductase subunit F
MRLANPRQLEKYRSTLLKDRDPGFPTIYLCAGTGCRASGAEKVAEAFRTEIEKHGLEVKVALKETGCRGFCERGPLLVVAPAGLFYQHVTVEDVPEIIEKTLVGGQVIDRLLYEDPVSREKIKAEFDIGFYRKQLRIVLAMNEHIDPTSIEDYIAAGGYAALPKALHMLPDDIIGEVLASGLRGRGGAGFPTGKKWKACRESTGKHKFIICNCDEGDPGAYMDRSILEGNPHSVLEGMIIGAFAIGADEGVVYVRNEYPLAVKHLGIAIDTAHEFGLLGRNILGSHFDLDVSICRGGGAFVCGEETALIASVEGRQGEARPRPPYPAQRGLWDDPTNINNVETWANVPHIINRGAKWFAGIGTEHSKGTKVFSLVGKICNTGLVEVPMGITMREIVYDIGGGVPEGGHFKAVQTGGPSGGCIPEKHLDIPIDFDRLSEVGSMMGSGGLIVMDDRTCMVDVARYFQKFLEDESCGKCTPCREGIRQMRIILDRIVEGSGREEDLDLLQELAETVADGSLCGLGQTAPNPVLTTLRYFKDEYLSHIRDGACPAGVCRALIHYRILEDKCVGCRACAKACPVECISGERKKPHKIDQSKCIKCGVCLSKCKFDAVSLERGRYVATEH